MEEKKKRFGLLLLLLFIVVVTLLLIFLLILPNGNGKSSDKADLKQVEGERHQGWTPFYFADEGTWKMLDPESYVLREMKFVSSETEREAYTVRKVESGGFLRIIQARGRWKQVEVLEEGEVVASGWIDAHNIKKVEKIR